MSKTKTVRIHLDTADRMKMVRSPGETDGELIDRALQLLIEVKNIVRGFCESKEYQDWLAKRRG